MKEANDNKCRLHVGEKPFDEAQMCFGLPKNSPLKQLLSKE